MMKILDNYFIIRVILFMDFDTNFSRTALLYTKAFLGKPNQVLLITARLRQI